MNQSRYEITFQNGDKLRKRALTEEQAKILAQAEQIENGKDYTVLATTKLGEMQ